MIDEVHVECEQDGFWLVLTGDFQEAFERYLADPNSSSVSLRLGQDGAIQLNAQVRGQISPWVDDMNFHRDDYERASPEERERVLVGDAAREAGYPTIGGAMDEAWAEVQRERADLERKTRRERS